MWFLAVWLCLRMLLCGCVCVWMNARLCVFDVIIKCAYNVSHNRCKCELEYSRLSRWAKCANQFRRIGSNSSDVCKWAKVFGERIVALKEPIKPSHLSGLYTIYDKRKKSPLARRASDSIDYRFEFDVDIYIWDFFFLPWICPTPWIPASSFVFHLREPGYPRRHHTSSQTYSHTRAHRSRILVKIYQHNLKCTDTHTYTNHISQRYTQFSFADKSHSWSLWGFFFCVRVINE